jgi:hypothetical protein
MHHGDRTRWPIIGRVIAWSTSCRTSVGPGSQKRPAASAAFVSIIDPDSL